MVVRGYWKRQGYGRSAVQDELRTGRAKRPPSRATLPQIRWDTRRAGRGSWDDRPHEPLLHGIRRSARSTWGPTSPLRVLPYLAMSIPDPAPAARFAVQLRVRAGALLRAPTAVAILVFLAPDQSILLRVETTTVPSRHNPRRLRRSESRGG